MTPEERTSTRVLLLPGLFDSGVRHWQSRWEERRGYRRVTQNDWQWPRRGDWMARLDEVLLNDGAPAVLVAHSLGCHLVAAWAAHSTHAGLVRAALLVAPPDTEREDSPPNVFNWRPMIRGRLPFPSILVVSSNDPFCSVDRALGLAGDWGSDVHLAGEMGHINADSDLDDWPEGHALLTRLVERA
jgi:predicted alpha/beta hydrolase family esterase